MLLVLHWTSVLPTSRRTLRKQCTARIHQWSKCHDICFTVFRAVLLHCKLYAVLWRSIRLSPNVTESMTHDALQLNKRRPWRSNNPSSPYPKHWYTYSTRGEGLTIHMIHQSAANDTSHSFATAANDARHRSSDSTTTHVVVAEATRPRKPQPLTPSNT